MPTNSSLYVLQFGLYTLGLR